MAMNPSKLKPIDIVRLVNSTQLQAVLNDRQLRRHRDRAGFRITDDGGQSLNLFKYAAWLREQLLVRETAPVQTYESKKAAVRNRNIALAIAGRDIGELPEVVDPERKKLAERSFRLFCESYFSGNRSRPSFLTEPPSVGGNGQELVRANSKISLL